MVGSQPPRRPRTHVPNSFWQQGANEFHSVQLLPGYHQAYACTVQLGSVQPHLEVTDDVKHKHLLNNIPTIGHRLPSKPCTDAPKMTKCTLCMQADSRQMKMCSRTAPRRFACDLRRHGSNATCGPIILPQGSNATLACRFACDRRLS